MLDDLMPMPTAPDGVEGPEHLRDMLDRLQTKAFDAIGRLHLEIGPELREEASAASTELRHLRAATKELLDGDFDDEDGLVLMLGMLNQSLEHADWVLASDDLRIALRHHLPAWERVQWQALAITQMAVSGYCDYLFGKVQDVAALQRVSRPLDVPVTHALMRAIVAGMFEADRRTLVVDDLEWEFDQLLGKSIKELQHPRLMPYEDPLIEQRMAGIGGCALWNLTRRAIRRLDSGERAEYEQTRREQLHRLRRDMRPFEKAFGVMPDIDYWYDVGVAFAHIDPLLARAAESKGIRLTRRAEPMSWYRVLGPGVE